MGVNDCIPVNIITCKWRAEGKPWLAEPTMRETHEDRFITLKVSMERSREGCGEVHDGQMTDESGFS